MATTANAFNLKQLIGDLLLVLTEKEKMVIERRFGLKRQKETLESIGRSFKVTRERIRQIEEQALKKLRRTAMATKAQLLGTAAEEILSTTSGILGEKTVVEKIRERFPAVTGTDESIVFALSTDKEIERRGNTILRLPYWRLISINEQAITQLGDSIYELLQGKKDPLAKEAMLARLQRKITNLTLTSAMLDAYLEIDKRVKILENGAVALWEWRHINPRTLRDKIIFILREWKKPMHFTELARTIIAKKFDKKRINLQAVHNELIRNDDFVLIGRGIYALREWGYKDGTVKDVIREILKKKSPRGREEIMKEVLKQRTVKRITIYLNLKDKKTFARVGRDQYALK